MSEKKVGIIFMCETALQNLQREAMRVGIDALARDIYHKEDGHDTSWNTAACVFWYSTKHC